VGSDLTAPPGTEVIDAQGCAVIPGLINAHTHLYQNFLKGVADGLPLVPWCEATLFPMVRVIHYLYRVEQDGRAGYYWSLLGALEMIRGGTTCCVDMDISMESIFRAWQDVGLRGVAAITLSNRWLPPDLVIPEAILKAEALDYAARWHDPGGLVRIALGPSTPFLCDEALLTWTRATAQARDLAIHIHVAETMGEVTESLEEKGLRPAQYLNRLGLLEPRLSAVHCVHIAAEEIATLAASGATVVHCPKSNMKLADGVAPVTALMQAGVPVALGTDGCASNDLLDMWEEMRAAVLLARVSTGDAAALSAAEVFRMATDHGARACGVDAGILDVGRLADVAIVDLSGPHLRPVHDIVKTLVYCARATDVRDTVVGGRVVMREREIITVDEAALLAEADAMGRELYTRAQWNMARQA
ncbi:MAG: amidohydrolase, partial [Chloroflexota bacterium]|nr:amidohydrolase [Chloroflexota bacterium]